MPSIARNELAEDEAMNRRRFLQMSAGAMAMSAVSANAHSLKSNAFRSLLNVSPVSAADFRAGRRFAETKYGRIAYVERGEGSAALFLHGFPLNSFQWRDVIDRLQGHRRCITPDFLGLGYTEVKKGQSVAPAAQVEMIAALLDLLSISSVDLIANDSGGAVAQLFVTRYPKRVRTLLLTNCDAEPDSPPPAVLPVIKLAHEGKFADQWLAPWVADKTLARSAKGLGGLCYSDPTHPTDEAIDCYLRPLVSSPQRKALTNAYAMGLDPNPLAGIESKLKQCTVPTRIVWGTGDTIFSQASADYLDRTFANSQGVRRVPGAKLFFPEEMPEVITEEALKLWKM
jgi:pimeloyl-ACP methyl ester carboxylesterase